MSRRPGAGGGGKGLSEDHVLEKVMRDRGALLWTKNEELDCKKDIIEEFIKLNPAIKVQGYNYNEEDHSPLAIMNRKIALAVEDGDYELAAELRRQRDEGEDRRLESGGKLNVGYLASLNISKNPRRVILKSLKATGLKGRPGNGKGQTPTFVGRQNFTLKLKHGNDDHLPRDRFGNPIQPPKPKKRFDYIERNLNIKTHVPWRDQKLWNWPLTGKPHIEDPRAQQ